MKHALLILLLTVAMPFLSACVDETPAGGDAASQPRSDTVEATPARDAVASPQAPDTQESIQAVYSFVASLPTGEPLRPLFAHQSGDQGEIASLARVLDAAIPIASGQHLWVNDRGRYLSLRYSDGRKLTIRQVVRCEPWSDADAKESVGRRCLGTWTRRTDAWWVEGRGIVESQDLTRWWDRMTTFMVPIGSVGIPRTVKAGEPFQITLMNWDDVIGGSFMNLSLVPLEGPEIHLGTIPVSDLFQGQLAAPKKASGGRYWLRVAGGGFSELVISVELQGDYSPEGTRRDAPDAALTATPEPIPTAGRNTLEDPPRGPGVEPGKGYPYSLYVHCGVRDAYFDGRHWMADPMQSDGSGNPPPGWTSEDSRGIMVLVTDDLAIFTAESGREVEFVPWPSDVEWRPCY